MPIAKIIANSLAKLLIYAKFNQFLDQIYMTKCM